MKRPYRYKSPNNEKLCNVSPVYSGLDYFRMHLRIRAALRAFGPMSTARLVHWAGSEFTEEAVRIGIKQLEDAGEIVRPIQGQRWRLCR